MAMRSCVNLSCPRLGVPVADAICGSCGQPTSEQAVAPSPPVAPPPGPPAPSVVPTVLITVFFGVFGAIPAFLTSRSERSAGRPTSRYWKAFWITLAAVVAAYGVVIGVSLAASHTSNSPTAAQPQVSTSQSTSTLPSPSPSPSSSAPSISNAALVRIARTGGALFGTYDYRHLDQDFARVKALLTPGFATQYSDTTAALKPTIIEQHAISSVTVRSARLRSRTADSAEVLVTIYQTVRTSTQAPHPAQSQLVVRLELQSDGRWLISSLAVQ